MNLTEIVSHIVNEDNFKNFDYYMIKQLGLSPALPLSEELKKKAFHQFMQKTNSAFPASPLTIRKWFGIGGISTPSREQIYEIAFSLHLSTDETEELLTKGLKEPSFQINDYKETIWLYGLHHQLSLDECSDLIDEYEKTADFTLTFCRTHSTHELLQQFGKVKSYNKTDFLSWLLENAPYFKGYSQTALDYMNKYRQLTARIMSQECAYYLKRLLQETDYDAWKKKNPFPASEKNSVRKYIYRHPQLEPELRKNIMDMVTIIYSDKASNQAIMKELYAGNKKRKNIHQDIPYSMSEKYLSDLFHVSVQKERLMRSTFALAGLQNTTVCPKEVAEMIYEYSYGKVTPKTSQEAAQWLTSYVANQKRRCLFVQRSDLLPFILYVTQKRYLEEISYDYAYYERKKVLDSFVSIANATLNACNMALLDEHYILDRLLLACFQEEELYSYGELLECFLAVTD